MSDVIRDKQKFIDGWKGGLPETPCGSGSTLERTRRQREWIPELIAKYGITSIVDVGAGDLNWIRQTKLPAGTSYRAYDLVPREPSVEPMDLVTTAPPAADLLMCLWVLNHLPFREARQAIANLHASGSKYLLMTDRPRWHHEQPPEIHMPYIEAIDLETPGQDRMLLIDLRAC